MLLDAAEVFARGERREQIKSWVQRIHADGLSPCLASGGEDVPEVMEAQYR